MNDLFKILGMTQRTEDTIKELNFNSLKEQNLEFYNLIQDNIINHKRQYELFCKIINFDTSNIIYHNYLEFKNVKSEYVYFIKNYTTGLIKIGMTTNPHQRLIDIKTNLNNATGVNNELKYVGIIRMTSTNMKIFEKMLHEKYTLYRKNGEWFDLSEDYILNTYFPKQYKIKGIPFLIEMDNRNIDNFDKKIPDVIWEHLIIHKIMKICNKNYINIGINNPYLDMYLFYLEKNCLNINFISSIDKDSVIEQIIRKATYDI